MLGVSHWYKDVAQFVLDEDLKKDWDSRAKVTEPRGTVQEYVCFLESIRCANAKLK